MSIEYLPGLNPGDKIDLSGFDKYKKKSFQPELFLPSLQEKIRNLAERPGYKGFINEDGRIIMTGDQIETDLENIKIKEEVWAKEKGLNYASWLLKRESDPSNLAEMGLTLLFDRILGNKFAVLRASDYDDYENGADNIVIDRATGAVICGVDDVLGHEGDDGGAKKEEKIKRKMEKGGVRLKYGATVEDGTLIPKSLENIPLFYFSLSKEELTSLLNSLTHNNKPNVDEQKIYQKLIISLETQHTKFVADKSLAKNLQANLANFSPSLEKMKAEIKA